MAVFAITAPRALDDVKTIVQDDSPDFGRNAQNFVSISPAGTSFIATENIQSMNYVTGLVFSIEQPSEFADVVIRPGAGQVYPRTL